MTRKISRQREWQIKKIAEGKCSSCGKPRTLSKYVCNDCLKKRREYQRKKVGCRPYKPGGRGRIPLERKVKS